MDRQENDMEKMFQEKVAQRKANQEMTISEKMAQEELVEGKNRSLRKQMEKSLFWWRGTFQKLAGSIPGARI